MKRLLASLLVAVLVLSLTGVATAAANRASDMAKDKAPNLERIEFIHWKKDFAKPPCNNNGTCEPELGENKSCPDCKKNGGDEEPPPESTCYAFMVQYGPRLLKWGDLPVDYVINPANSGLLETEVTSAISAAAGEWDEHADVDIFGSYSTAFGDTTTYNDQNFVNAISFGDYYSNPDIIGACMIWYSPATKTIVEFDIIFETNYTWGVSGAEILMDLQNIATHELGHAVGLADIYETECAAVTMYGYSSYGETDKSSLELPDITGIKQLY